MLLVASCVSCVVCCLLIGRWLWVVVCRWFVVCCLLCVVLLCCSIVVLMCAWFVVCCSSYGLRCLLVGVC